MRLIDPAGTESSKTVVLTSDAPSESSTKPKPQPLLAWTDAVVNFASDKILFDAGTIVDGKTLDILSYYTQADVQTGLIPVGYKTFSPDDTYI